MYSSIVDKIRPAIGLLDECRSSAESIDKALGGRVFEDLDESCADALAAPSISAGAAACRQSLAALRNEIEASTGGKPISYEAEQEFSACFEHDGLADIAANVADSLKELIGDFMCAEKDLLEALAASEEFERRAEELKGAGYERALREMAEDPKISFEVFVEMVDKTLGCPIHERGIEAFGTLASRVEEAAEVGDWSLWPIMEALSKHPRSPLFNVEHDPIVPITNKADLIAALLPKAAG